MAGGDESLLNRIQSVYKIDRGELQRFWESSEMYLQLVTSMCEALNWNILKRLLHSLRGWFKTRIPKSYACFLHEEDNVPFPCLQLLSEEELTIRDIAEMDKMMIARILRIGMWHKYKMDPIDYTTLPSDPNVTSFIVKRRPDLERFLDDMDRIAGILKQRAQEWRTHLEVNKMFRDWEKDTEISVLTNPLATEKEAMLNAIENEQSQGERSEGVLSVSDESLSEIVEESDGEPKRVRISPLQEFDANFEDKKMQSNQNNQMTFGERQDFCADDTPGPVEDQNNLL